MSISLSDGQIISGAAITGLTTPTYTLKKDVAPDIYSVQYAVTALGGTQTGVSLHSPTSPFTVTIKRPKALKTLGSVNPQTVLLTSSNVSKNPYSVIVRKGGVPLANNIPQVMLAKLEFSIPAGVESYSAAEIKAFASFTHGVMTNQIQGLVDTMLSGIL